MKISASAKLMELINQWTGRSIILFYLLLLPLLNAYAGTITNISVSAGSLETTTSTTYTFTFTPATTINSSNWSDGAYFWFNFDDDFIVSGASLVSITPNISGMNINNRNDSTGEIRMYTGNGSASINAGQQYIVVLSGVQNPATAQTPVAHQIRTGNGSSVIDTGTVAAEEIVSAASNPPVVQSQIPDKTDLAESEGAITYVSDLNNNFLDSDGDALSFVASSSDSSIVAVSLSGTNDETLSIEAKKFGSATITVTATSVDGSVDDTFDVSTIGLLPINSVSEGSLETTVSTTYTFVFTPETTVNSGMWCDGAYFLFNLDDDFTVSGATLGSISPSISGMSIVSLTDSTGVIMMHTNSGAITGGQQYTVVLNGVQNPPTAQTPVAHQISTGEGCGTVDIGTIAANAVTVAATNPPVVSAQIPDKDGLLEADDVVEYIADLNNHFFDGDGDTMNFSASSSDPSVVAVSLSGANDRTLSIQAQKAGSADITVTATATDGSVNDVFNVIAIGELIMNSISSSSNVGGQTTSVTVDFTLETTVSDAGGDGAYLYFDFPDDYGVGAGTSISVTSPSVAGSSGVNAGNSGVYFIATASTIPAGTYTAVISNVMNPGTGGSYGNLVLDTRNGGSTIYDIGSTPLPAIMTPYSVSYDGNGNTDGSPPVDNNDYINGATVTVANNVSLVRTGYTFSGWNTAANGSGTSYSGGQTFTMGSADVTLYAQWTLIPTYTVTYNDNGSDGGNVPTDANAYQENETVTVLDNSGNLTLTGHTFSGWNTAANGSGTAYKASDTFAMGSADITLYAQWTLIPTYTVTYDDNGSDGGSVPTDANAYQENETVTVLDNSGNLTLTGHTFSGWNTAANGSGTAYNASDTFAMGAANVTLYAQWTLIPTYTITYDGNFSDGGTVPVDANTYQENETVTVLGNTGSLTRSGGYTFIGWNTAENGSGTSYIADDTFSMATANVTLYAQWTLNPTYTVTYDGNNNDSGEQPIDANAYEENATVTVLGNTGNLGRSGYTFSGWNTSVDGLGTAYNAGETFSMGSADVTLYAQWILIPTYTVTYDGNGSDGGTPPTDANAYEENDTVTVLDNTGNLSRSGYTFSGWNTSADGLGTAYNAGETFTMGSADVTLYAQWTATGDSIFSHGFED